MEKLNILIVEDNMQEAAGLREQLLNSRYLVCGIANELGQARDMFDRLQPDLCIVDIFLNGKRDGIAFAQNVLNSGNTKHPFIFLTGSADRTTFESAKITGPFSYLLKPYNELELQYALELAIERIAQQEGHFNGPLEAASVFVKDAFFVKKGNMLVKVPVNDIQYIEVDGKYCKLAYGNEKSVVQTSMKHLHDQLPARMFVRVHRNFIANLGSIQKVNLQEQEIILQDGKSIAYSRHYTDELMHALNILK